ncbi:hypothetical protein FWF89_03495 [Candidatus Saccharibacteria bacterium]|nr:hypothetical protein [Candidatus Saccharibacteria bacterium]
MENMVETKAESEARQQAEMHDQVMAAAETIAKEQKKPLKILTIVLSIMVLGLIGVSVLLIVNIANREECVLSGEVDDEENADEGDPIAGEGGPYIADGYLAVPEWGVKFKLTDDLTDYGYSVLPKSLASSYGTYVVGMTAVFKKDLEEDAQARYYATIDFCSFVTVSRTTSNMSNVVGPKKIVTIGSYSYVIYDFTAHGGCVDKGAGLMSSTYYGQVAEKLTEILSKPESLHAGFTGTQ